MDAYELIREMWYAYNIKSTEALNLALKDFKVLFAYHSCKIENNEIDYHNVSEIFENEKVCSYTGSTRALFEQQNQKLCYDFLKEKIVAKELLSLSLILEIHSILTSGTYDERRFIVNEERPGHFKKHDYVTGKNEIGLPPNEVESGLTDLINELNDYDGNDVLKAAAYFHLRFEHIHPFADGNGRVGRTLLNYFLLIHGEPPVIVFDEDKRKYYDALETYDIKEEIDPLYDFLKKQTVKTWEKTYERSQKSNSKKPKSLKEI